MPNLVVYVPAKMWARLEDEFGTEFPAWARQMTVKHMQEFLDGRYVTGLSERTPVSSDGAPLIAEVAGSSPAPAVRSESPRPRNYVSEPFSLVCSNRDAHRNGVYCSECKGDRGGR